MNESDSIDTVDTLDDKADGATLTNPIEDVHAYDDCLLHGVTISEINLGTFGFRDPATYAGFVTTECIVNHLTATDPQSRPYNLQSVKKGAVSSNGSGRQVYFLKQGTTPTSTGGTPACLKVKLFASVGATQVDVTIERVKVLPAPRADGLCSDNGEI